MKKFFAFIAAILFAGSMMADDITCAAAVAAGNALEDGATDTTATVSVVGYVSIAEGWKSDSKQQIFYMADDSASTDKSFEAYYCNTEVAIKRGDKVRVIGFLTKYVNKNSGAVQIEIKNGDVELIQAAAEQGPAEIKLYTVSEFIAAFDNGTLIEGDSCKVVGVISKWYSKSSKFDQYHSVSYFITDGEKEFEMYNSYSIDNAKFATYEFTDSVTATCIDENGIQLNIGDSVIGIGTAKKYNSTYEFNQNCYLVWTNAGKVEKPELPEGVISCDSAVALAKSIADPEEVKGTVEGPEVTVWGYVTYAYDTSDREGVVTQSAWLSDTKGSKSGVIQGSYLQIANMEAAVAVGDYVELKGTLAKYLKEGKDGKPNEVVVEVIRGSMRQAGEQGIENVVLTEKAQKVMIDGVMYIVRDNKMYNVQGTQVR